MHVDEAIAQIAARCGGNISLAQLRTLGLSRGAIAHRVATGYLRRRFRGVFAVGHEAEPPHAWEWAAVLYGGRGAAISHESAIRTMELLPAMPRTVIHVSLPSRSTRTQDGIRLHRTPSLRRPDLGRWDGLPITTAARALLDFAPTAVPRDLERAVAEAFVQELVNRRKLEAVLGRYPTHPGVPYLKAILTGDPKLTHRGIEERLLASVRRARFPEPEVNVRLHGWEVDFLWREKRLVVETDSARFHGVPAAVERDRRKDADLRARGYTVLRYSWSQVTRETELVIAEIARALH